MSKTALVTGIAGQDGAYLSRVLLKNGYKVFGGDRRTSSGSLWRLKKLGIEKDVEIVDFELAEFTNIFRTIEKCGPDEVYNLASQSFVKASFEMPTMTADITGIGVCRILEAIRQINPKIKFYQASSSEMFGGSGNLYPKQNEGTPFYPRSPYGVSKLFGHWMTVNYRESYDMYCCSGILFNHESPLRSPEFVTRKITMGIANIVKGNQDHIKLGNLDAKRDWGFAGEYMEAVHLMLQQDKPDDYVIATGETHSVREFVEKGFSYVDLEIEWKGVGVDAIGIDQNGVPRIKVNPECFRPADVVCLRGDPFKFYTVTGWLPKVTFEELAGAMVGAEFKD